MKKYLVLTVALFSLTTAFSQSHFYTSFGYNLGYANLKGLNFVVDRYNATRTPPIDTTWISFDEMENFHFPNGFCASLGGSSGKLMYDLTWVGRHMTRKAGGVQPNGVTGIREFKWRMNTFNFGLGVALGQSLTSRVNIGVSIDLGNEKVFTRINQDGVYVNGEDFQEVQKNLIVGSTLFMQIILSPKNVLGGFFIRPYIQLPYFKTSYYNTNAQVDVNPVALEDVESNSWNVGVQLQIGLFKRRD
jgi:hypothetical protein